MGEAKRRGTFEQRKALAIKRNQKLKQQMLANADLMIDITPEIKKRQAAQLLSTEIGLMFYSRMRYKI